MNFWKNLLFDEATKVGAEASESRFAGLWAILRAKHLKTGFLQRIGGMIDSRE